MIAPESRGVRARSFETPSIRKEIVMKKLAIPGMAIALLTAGALAEPAKRLKGDAWLAQLVGAWDIQFKVFMDPDQPPSVSAGTDTVRALGGNWIIAQTETTMMGTPYEGVMSLGYDAEQARFHGTWIDSFGGHMWIYEGTLNDAGDTLTLRTEGPSLEVPGETAQYKEIIQVTGDDSRTFNSYYESGDGSWVKIVTIEYSRKK